MTVFGKFFTNNRFQVGFLSVLLLLISTVIKAQDVKKNSDLLNEARAQFTSQNYATAVKTCKQVLATEPLSKEAHLILADVYHKTDSLDLEIFHLNKAGEIGREWEVVFRLGEAHFKKGNYPEALRYYNIYSDYEFIDDRRQFLLACKMASCRFAFQSVYDPNEYKQQNATGQVTDEYWPSTSEDGKKLVFTKITNNQGTSPREEFAMAKLDSATWNISKLYYEKGRFDNEGVQTLSKDSRIMFFTACNRDDGVGNCDIYFIRYLNGKWSSPLNAGNKVNSAYWDAQPSFSSNGRFLYFSSDRPGGKGKKDIWRAELLGFSNDGTPQWKEPENLGDKLNTAGDEISPFLHPNGRTLYFISDKLTGMGGKDLFTAEPDESGKMLYVKNMGHPVNTINDELGLTVCSVGGVNYFSTARSTDAGMEIFAFNLDRGLTSLPFAYVKVKVTDAKSKKNINVPVKLETQPVQAGKFQLQETGDDGETLFCLQLNRNYVFSVAQPDYLFYSSVMNPVESNTIENPLVLDIRLQPIEIGAEVQLYNIYFQTDSFRILPQSVPELNNLVTFLKNNSELKVEIQGHTDSSGNPERNQVLSERRAKSVVEYLTGNGITPTRLKFGGYGDKLPIATNETPEGRTLNRRTTIKILDK